MNPITDVAVGEDRNPYQTQMETKSYPNQSNKTYIKTFLFISCFKLVILVKW